MKVTINLEPILNLETIYKHSDIDPGLCVLSDSLDSVLIPIDEFWVGFGIHDNTIGVIDDDKLVVEGKLCKYTLDVRI